MREYLIKKYGLRLDDKIELLKLKDELQVTSNLCPMIVRGYKGLTPGEPVGLLVSFDDFISIISWYLKQPKETWD